MHLQLAVAKHGRLNLGVGARSTTVRRGDCGALRLERRRLAEAKEPPNAKEEPTVEVLPHSGVEVTREARPAPATIGGCRGIEDGWGRWAR